MLLPACLLVLLHRVFSELVPEGSLLCDSAIKRGLSSGLTCEI